MDEGSEVERMRWADKIDGMDEILRNKRIKIIVICFAIMLGLTVMSRAADSITVARVNVQTLARGVIVHKTVVEGTIGGTQKHYIYNQSKLRIQEIHVGQGSKVAVGDLLFTLNPEEVKEALQIAENELLTLNLEIEKLRMESGGGAAGNAAVASAQAELDRAVADDAFSKTLNDGQQMLADKRRIEDAQKKLAEAKQVLSESKKKGSIDISLKESSRQLKEKEYSALKVIDQNGSKITADIDGTIGEIFVKQGELATTGDLCTIIPEDAAYEFIGELKVEDAEYLKTGDAVSITPMGKDVPITGVTIKSLSKTEEKATVIGSIEKAGTLNFGESATMLHENKSAEYKTLIPIGALRGTEGDYYVLILQDGNGILGSGKVAQKVLVTVLDKDNKNVAIRGELGTKDEIIVRSSKAISGGDRVREQISELRNN